MGYTREKSICLLTRGEYIFSQEAARGATCWDFEGNWITLLKGWAEKEDVVVFVFKDAREMCEWYLK